MSRYIFEDMRSRFKREKDGPNARHFDFMYWRSNTRVDWIMKEWPKDYKRAVLRINLRSFSGIN